MTTLNRRFLYILAFIQLYNVIAKQPPGTVGISKIKKKEIPKLNNKHRSVFIPCSRLLRGNPRCLVAR